MNQGFFNRIELILHTLDLFVAGFSDAESVFENAIKLALELFFEITKLPGFFFEVIDLASFQKLVTFEVMLLFDSLTLKVHDTFVGF